MAQEAQAKQRFFIINVARISGMVLVLLALAIYYRKIQMPVETAYVIAVLGLIEFFVVPQMLAKKWRSPDR